MLMFKHSAALEGHDGLDKEQISVNAAFTLQVHKGEGLPSAVCLIG